MRDRFAERFWRALRPGGGAMSWAWQVASRALCGCHLPGLRPSQGETGAGRDKPGP